MGVRAGGIDTVEGSLRAYVTPETLDGDNQWQCSDEPVRRVDALKGISFQRFPRLLTLHLKRFVFDYATMRRRKLNDVLRFGETLDVGEFLGAGSGDGDGDGGGGGDGAAGEGGGGDRAGTRYELFAILIHSGSAGGGHYYSYIKDVLPAAPPAAAAAPSQQCGGGAAASASASASASAAAGSDGVASGWSSYNDAHVRQLDASSLQMMMSGTATSSAQGTATAAAGAEQGSAAHAADTAAGSLDGGAVTEPAASEPAAVASWGSSANAYMLVYRRVDGEDAEGGGAASAPYVVWRAKS
jgi:hypothetical protein